MSTRSLEPRPVTSPPANQKKATRPAALIPNFACKNFSARTIREFGFFEHKPPVHLAWPCNKPFSAPNSDFSVGLASLCFGHLNFLVGLASLGTGHTSLHSVTIVLQKQTQKKEIRFVVTGWRECVAKTEWRGQKAQTSSYKINKCQEYNVQRDQYN